MKELALIAVVLGLALLAKMFMQQSWGRTADRLGLALSDGFLVGREARGSRDGFWVRVYPTREAFVGVVDGRGKIPEDLKLGAENLLTRTMAPDILTGDAPFDHRARVTGAEELALAVLDPEARALVLGVVVESGAAVDGGRVTIRRSGLPGVTEAIPGMIDLAKRLVLREGDVPERLARNAASDYLPAVRLRNLRLLQEKYFASAQAREASRLAATSSHPELRLEGAMYLGDEGLGVVCEVAADEGRDEDLRLRAVEHLFRPSFAAVAIPVLERLLESASPRLVRAAVVGLGRYRHRAAVARLVALAEDADDRTAEVIAITLGRIADPAAEGCLLELLSRQDGRIRVAAARALGWVGSATAVEPLLEIARGRAPGELKKVAREAVDNIQSRLVGAEAGQLSIAPPAEYEGGLSPVEEPDERGGLSLETEDESDTGGA